MCSRITSMNEIAGTMRNQEDLIVNWFEATMLDSGRATKAVNRKSNLIARKSCGFKKYEMLKIAL